MSINVNTGGLWKEAAPFVRHAGSWKEAGVYVRQSGLWYQVSQSGLNLVIDSATPLYDFNLKSWLQNAGLWPASGPVIINELRISARTVITHTQLTTRTPSTWGGGSGVPVPKVGYELIKTKSVGQVVTTAYGSTFYTEYVHDLWEYRPDFNVYAFTTGNTWPTGSKIKVFVVEGTIQGRGGDGAGLHGDTTYNVLTWVEGGTKTANTRTVNGLKTFMNGWGALEVTIPVDVLHVPGVVAGGGAGGCYPGPVYFSALTSDPVALANAEAMAAAVSNLDSFAGMSSAGRRVTEGGGGMPFVGGNAAGVMHGCGGGQGGSFGGISNKIASSGNAANYYTYVNGVDGGNGTLDVPGAAGTSTTSYNSNDTKYGGTPSKAVGGGIPGAVRGADATHKTDVTQTTWDGTLYSIHDLEVATPYTVNVPYAGEARYFPTVPLFSRGGSSVQGRNLITNVNGNLFGAQK